MLVHIQCVGLLSKIVVADKTFQPFLFILKLAIPSTQCANNRIEARVKIQSTYLCSSVFFVDGCRPYLLMSISGSFFFAFRLSSPLLSFSRSMPCLDFRSLRRRMSSSMLWLIRQHARHNHRY